MTKKQVQAGVDIQYDPNLEHMRFAVIQENGDSASIVLGKQGPIQIARSILKNLGLESKMLDGLLEMPGETH